MVLAPALVIAGFVLVRTTYLWLWRAAQGALATAMALPAGIDRIPWLPTSIPGSPMTPDLYMLLAILPMFAWDVARNRRVHRAYGIWLAISLPFAIAVHGLWGTQWWHQTAPRLMGDG